MWSVMFSVCFNCILICELQLEEMRDEYILKLKLRDGAVNLAQALSSQPSKAAKEKLQEVRCEQKDLLEVVCVYSLEWGTLRKCV